jgi:hypothetical protein
MLRDRRISIGRTIREGTVDRLAHVRHPAVEIGDDLHVPP